MGGDYNDRGKAIAATTGAPAADAQAFLGDHRVYTVIIKSTAGGATTVNLRNGIVVGAPSILALLVPAASSQVVFPFTGLQTFPAGCFIDCDANTAAVFLEYA